MRLFQIRYVGGYNTSSYSRELRQSFEGNLNYYLSYAAAEASIPPLSDQDIYENSTYDENIHFAVVEVEITPQEIYNYLWNMGDVDTYPAEGYYPHKNYWVAERWYGAYHRYMRGEHKVHVFADDRRLVEFFNTESRRVETMKPGKYLKKYYGDVLNDRQIAFMAEFWMTGERPKITATVKFATTEQEILRVYNEGPRSCMRGSNGVIAYAAGDLAIAYIDEDGRPRARALCWPEKKIYGRVYPNVENYEDDGFESMEEAEQYKQALANKLREDGYVSIQEKPDGFDGARLLARNLPGRDGQNGYVHMPYLDNQLAFEFDEEGRQFRLKADGPLSATGTGGWVRLFEAHCTVCGVKHVADDNQRNTVLRNYSEYENGAENVARVCSACKDSNVFTKCEATERNFLNEGNTFTKIYNSPSGDPQVVIMDYAVRNGWQSATGKWYYNYSADPVYVDNQKYHRQEVVHSRMLRRYFLNEEERRKAEAEYKPMENKIVPFVLVA